MNTCAQMMDRMKSIVKKQKIRDRTDKISGVIIIRFLISMHMLNIIKYQDRKQRELLRNNNIQDSLLPVDQESRQNKSAERHILHDGNHKLGPVAPPKKHKIGGYGTLLKIAAYTGITQEGEEIVPLADSVCDSVVPHPIIELVVIFIMRGYPSKHRKPIKQSYPIVGYYIKDPRIPDLNMIMIMRDYRHRDRKVERQDINENVESRIPLNHQNQRSQEEVS